MSGMTGMTEMTTIGGFFSRDNLSSTTGMLSIFCWFIVFVPQFRENYKRKSGESISLPFLFIWLMGDLLNLVGSTLDNLLLTMRILAWYYVLTDIILIGQVHYYNRINKATESTTDKINERNESSTDQPIVVVVHDEETALLFNKDTQKNQHHNYNTSALPQGQSSNSPTSDRTHRISDEAKELHKRRRIRQFLMITLPIAATTFLVWMYYQRCDNCLPVETDPGKGNDDDKKKEWLGVTLGWGSAILYLGSRIPQIYRNWRLQSTEGLSILMFMFAVLGNVFYVASIFLNSMDYDYLIQNMPWWIGSGGTLVFDFM
ncbi:hypothetical protein BGZ49_003740 [Haplosporangium sp. Z 27]|nr:hypothetical protein BGZ49_003740 [Haplosporangium sp. Z 27]